MKKNELRLRSIVREMVWAEITNQSEKFFQRSSANTKRICGVIDRETRNAITISKKLEDLEAQILCGVKTGHRLTILYIYDDACVFRCMKCNLEYTKSKEDFNKQELALLKAVLEN